MNNLFFYNNLFYTAPMAHYNYGCIAARDVAHVHELLGTKAVDLLPLGKTDAEGNLCGATDIRPVTKRTENETRTISCNYYQVKEGVDLTSRENFISNMLHKQYGWPQNEIHVNMSRMIKIEGDYTSDGKPKWRAMVTVDSVDEPLPMFLTFEGNDGSEYEDTGEQTEYEYQVSVDVPLTPMWVMIDLLEEANLLETLWMDCAYVARKACYSDVPVDGWEEVKEEFGDHTFHWWLNPKWQIVFKNIVDELKAEMDKELEETTAAPLQVASDLNDMMDFDNIPGVDPDAGVEGGVDPSKEDDNCAGGACKI